MSDDRFEPRRLSEQAVVINGATSGIGLVTAREAVRRGARVVVVDRNEDALAGHPLAAGLLPIGAGALTLGLRRR